MQKLMSVNHVRYQGWVIYHRDCLDLENDWQCQEEGKNESWYCANHDVSYRRGYEEHEYVCEEWDYQSLMDTATIHLLSSSHARKDMPDLCRTGRL